MKISKTNILIHGVIGILFAVVMCLLWVNKDFLFWNFMVSVWILIINSFLLFGYVEAKKTNNSMVMDMSLFVVPAVTLVVVILWTCIGPNLTDYSCNKFIAVEIIIFAVSLLSQFMLIKGRKRNLNVEQKVQQCRWNRDEMVFQWGRISQSNLLEEAEKKLAKEIENELRYSDPMSSDLLISIENEIANLTQRVKSVVDNGESIDEVKISGQKVLDLIRERNDKCKRMK